MTTGTQNVSDLLLAYRTLTLAFLLLFALYDCRHHKIRDLALLAFLPWCLASIPLMGMQMPLSQAVRGSFLGCLSGFLLLFAIAMATGGIGGGDIKLVALLGIPYGTPLLMGILLLSCLAALFYCGCLRMRKKGRPAHLPFAPFLFVGSLATTLLDLCF